jgi:hypothetical protein
VFFRSSLSENQLTGTIPSSIGQLTSLEYLYLGGNRLTGTIPIAVGQLPLDSLDVSNTRLTGTVPAPLPMLRGYCDLRFTFIACSSKPKETCMCSGRVSGDDCDTRRVITTTRSIAITTEGASTCTWCGECAILRDLWFEWRATCTDIVTIDACSLAPGTLVSVYRSECPTSSNASIVGCNIDGDCEPATISATIDDVFIIRVGLRNRIDDAIGNLVISCGTPTRAPTTTARAVTQPETEVDVPSWIENTQTTIIFATVLGYLFLCCMCVTCFIISSRRRKKRSVSRAEMTTARCDPEDTAASKTDINAYGPAPSDTKVFGAPSKNAYGLVPSDTSMVGASGRSSVEYCDGPRRVSRADAYHRPPAAATEPTHAKSNHDKQSDVQSGSLLRKAIGAELAVLHIPIADIELGKKLGEGAFGVVYKGEWHGKSVAVKQVKSSHIVGGDKAIAEFEAEVSKMASTAFHENLVQLHGVTTLENGDMAAVVEFCAQGSLVDALYGEKARNDWTASELLTVAYDAACGVVYLHRLGLIHRDIAARNVLLTKHNVAKVADFGMARLLDDKVYEQQTENAVGPLKWMAPEQMESRAYSRASDVFAFGVLLFEIFAREAPWTGVANLMAASKVMDGERMDVSSRNIPPTMAALMIECWAAKPSDRPSIEDVQRTLKTNSSTSDSDDSHSQSN